MKTRFIVGLLLGMLGVQSYGAEWLTSYKDATELSKKTGKPVMAYFTGSDWCVWCHRLDNEVLDTPTFDKWASDKVILLKLDYPQSTPQSADLKAQNQALQAKYSVDGYPTVHLLDYKGDDMGNQGYEEGGPNPWTTHLQSKMDTWMSQHPDIQAEYKRAASSSGYKDVPIADKPLHAKADLRNKGQFEIVVDRWLSANKPSLGGKVVLLELWSTASDDAAKVVPTLTDWSKQFPNDLAVLAVSNDEPGPVLKFMRSNDLPYFVGIDADGVMAHRLGVGPDPYFVVISPDAIVRWQGSASEAKDALTQEKLQAIINDAKATR
jgi:protein disulfide-isomerase